ncbi:hypothetical protein SESI111939_04420 [Serratia silvae]
MAQDAPEQIIQKYSLYDTAMPKSGLVRSVRT